jgi:hypothetical protein
MHIQRVLRPGHRSALDHLLLATLRRSFDPSRCWESSAGSNAEQQKRATKSKNVKRESSSELSEEEEASAVQQNSSVKHEVKVENEEEVVGTGRTKSRRGKTAK